MYGSKKVSFRIIELLMKKLEMDFIRVFDHLQNIVILQSYDIPAIIGLTKTW